jgi:plastocyanin
MSVFGRQVSGKTVAGIALLMIVTALLPVMTSAPARDIVLVTKDMAFYLEGDPSTPNPVIEVKAGERVRIVLRNQERGVMHDFAVPSMRSAIDGLRWNEQGDVTFDIPDVPGNYEYVCRPHLLMMKGVIKVVAR